VLETDVAAVKMGLSPLRGLSGGWYTEGMLDEWFCEIAGREIGPLSSQQLKAMAAKGQILPTDRVRLGAAGEWMPADHVTGLFAAHEEPQPLRAGPAGVHASPLPPAPSLPRAKPLAQPPVGPPPVSPSGITKGAGPVDVAAEPAGNAPLAHGGTITASLTRAKQKRRRQMLATGATVVVVAGVLIVCLVWAAGGFGEIKQGGGLTAVARKTATSAAQPKGPKGDGAESESKDRRNGGKADGAGAKQSSEKPPEKPAGQDDPDAKDSADEGKWVDASMSTAVVDQVPIQVQSVAWEGRKLGTLEGAYLVIHVEVKNPSRLPDNRLMFEGWSPNAPHRGVRLTDDQRKVYQAKEADPANTVANMLPIKIKAGAPAHDVLLFDAPSPKVKYLRL
jgi:hypothetical protein